MLTKTVELVTVCPYCGQPVMGEIGVVYGGEYMHAACHAQLGQDLWGDEEGEDYGD